MIQSLSANLPEAGNVANAISAIQLVFIVVGGLFAYHKWSVSVKTKRIELIEQIIRQLRFDEKLSRTMYMIDYDHFQYDDTFHDGETEEEKEREYEVDRLLSYLDFICYIYNKKQITESEFSIVKYEISRVCKSFDIQNYLWNLYHFSEKNGTTCSFHYLIDYMKKQPDFNEKVFEESESQIYLKTLVF